MKDIVVGCAAGKVNDKIVLDLSEVEDKEGQADVPIAMMPRTGEITLLQSDGDLSQEEFEEAINLAMDKLCVEEGKHVWMLFIDLHIIDNCGNLFDACELAVMAALKSTKLPSASIADDEVVLDHENTIDLPINNEVAMCTFVKIGDKLILDPTLNEEKVASARLNVGVTKDGNICAMQKGGISPLTKEDIFYCVDKAVSKTKELVEYL